MPSFVDFSWLEDASQFTRGHTLVLALVGATAYGFSDFLGGALARQIGSALTTVITQSLASVTALSFLLYQGGSVPGSGSAVQALWAGAFYGAGALLLYSGFAIGRISIVAPLCALANILIPFSFEHLFLRSLTLLENVGILLALLAGTIIAADGHQQSGDQRRLCSISVGAGLLSGVAFGVSDVLTGTLPPEQSFGAVALARAAAAAFALILVLLFAGWLHHRRPGASPKLPSFCSRRPRQVLGVFLVLVVTAGFMEAIGALGYIICATRDSMSVAAALVALFPIMSVVLAVIVFGERPSARVAVAIAVSTASLTLLR